MMGKKIYFSNYVLLQQVKVIFETVAQNADVAALDAWVRNLYAYAMFALKDNPQHLQMFGKIVR